MTDVRNRNSLPGFEERLLRELLTLVEQQAVDGQVSSVDRLRGRRRHRGRWVLSAAAAVAVTVGLLMPVLPAGGPGGPDPAAAAALYRLGRIARHHRAHAAPNPGQYVYTKSQSTRTMLVGTDYRDGDYRYVESAMRQIWIAPDGSGRLVEVEGRVNFPTPADEAAWNAAGTPDLGGDSGDDETYQAGGLYFQDLSGFSSEPDLLRPQLEAFATQRDESMFQAAGELLRETYAPTELRAALFTVLANLPGVQYLGDVIDQAGRTGIAVQRSDNGWTSELIFDPTTSALLGESVVSDSSVPPEAGSAIGISWSTAYLESSIVNSIGPDSIPGAGPRRHCRTIRPSTSRCNTQGG